MSRQFSTTRWQCVWPSFSRQFRKILLGVTPCVFLMAGCAEVQLPTTLIPARQLKEIALDWRVDQTSQPGAYEVSGKTNLPDRTQLTVAALRYLYPVAATARRFNIRPTYTILDYQSVTVERGTWQTQLDLWQVAPDRTLKENWQLDQQGLALRFNPGEEVVFLVTLAPIEKLPLLQQQLAKKGQKLADGTVHSSAEGERYAQFQQTLPVPLPTGSALSTAAQVAVENFGWGRRYLIPQEPQNPTRLERPSTRQTNAPARSEEFLR
jgi:hypothetical protein